MMNHIQALRELRDYYRCETNTNHFAALDFAINTIMGEPATGTYEHRLWSIARDNLFSPEYTKAIMAGCIALGRMERVERQLEQIKQRNVELEAGTTP